MTKGQSISLYKNLNDLGSLQGVKFAYAISRNINKLKSEMESIDKTLQLPEKYKEFDTARVGLAEKYADKDENGKPKKEKSANGSEQFIISIVNQKKFDKEFEAIKKEHQEAVDLRDKQIEEYTKLLEEESTVEFYKIKLEHVPESITTKQLNGIYDIIEE